MSEELVARPPPKHRTTQTENKHIHISNIHAQCWIRTHDPGFGSSEDSTCLRLVGYRYRRYTDIPHIYLSPHVVTLWYTYALYLTQSRSLIGAAIA
jgi:hypothetical protein